MIPETTSMTMLDGVRHGNEQAWQRFFDTYKTLVYMRGKSLNFSEADIEDLLMRVMKAFFDPQKKFTYDASKGRFRNYFSRVVRNAATDMYRSKRRHTAMSLDAGEKPIDLPDPNQDWDAQEEREWRSLLFGKALAEVRANAPLERFQCWHSCRINNVNARIVAREQGLSLATIYNYCNDIDRRIQEAARRLNGGDIW